MLTRPLEDGPLETKRQQLKQHLVACRSGTLELAQGLTEEEFSRQAHPDFSPVGWHLGHIAFTEALWILEHLAGEPNPLASHRRLFAADGLSKAAREQVPDLSIILAYLAQVRDRVFEYLAAAPLDEQLRWWWWLLQHESQHVETISIVLALHRRNQGLFLLSGRTMTPQDSSRKPPNPAVRTQKVPPVLMPAAEIKVGHRGIDAIDNEQPPWAAQVDSFYIDPFPVTQKAFREFIAAGGYDTQNLWSSQGWSWRLTTQVDRPLYWSEDPALDNHPVCGVSYYEAEAYARFVGKRLPTELEWERAVCWATTGKRTGLYPWGETWPEQEQGNFGGRLTMTTPVDTFPGGATPSGCQDLLGNVWEWTSSWFEGYPGFQAFPYRGYSEAYFDGRHRVLRGGSWATRPWALRGPLRNWYHPHIREIFAGFRCVQDLASDQVKT